MSGTAKQEKILIQQGLPRMGTEVAVDKVISKSVEAPALAMANFVGALIQIGTALGTSIYNFLGTKKAQKKQEKFAQAQQASANVINKTLNEVYQYGLAVIRESDLSPADPEFEKVLVQHIGSLTGYRGNCDADIYSLDDTETDLSKKTPWFKVRGGKIQSVSGAALPDNADALWMVGCRNVHDNWTIAYKKKLIQEGRQRELEQLEAKFSKGKLLQTLLFGGVGVILLGIVVYNVVQVDRLSRRK